MDREIEHQKRSHDKRAVDRTFKLGETVLVRNFVSGSVWLCGVLVHERGPRLFDVRLGDGRELHRHMDHLRKRAEAPDVIDDSETSDCELEFPTPSPTSLELENSQAAVPPPVVDPPPPPRRFVRERRPLDRLGH